MVFFFCPRNFFFGTTLFFTFDFETGYLAYRSKFSAIVYFLKPDELFRVFTVDVVYLSRHYEVRHVCGAYLFLALFCDYSNRS